MPPRVLIDTGAIYAFVTRTDPHHQSAIDFAKTWLARRGLFVLADLVFAETMTLLKVRHGARIALRVGAELRTNPAYLRVPIREALDEAAWEIFQRFEDKGWSYTDCALLALARRTGVTKIFAFDHHFDQMPEIERLPCR